MNISTVRYKIGELLRVEELAVKLGISLKTVRSWIYQRKIPFTRIGRRVYFAVAVVDEILNRNARAPVSSVNNNKSTKTE